MEEKCGECCLVCLWERASVLLVTSIYCRQRLSLSWLLISSWFMIFSYPNSLRMYKCLNHYHSHRDFNTLTWSKEWTGFDNVAWLIHFSPVACDLVLIFYRQYLLLSWLLSCPDFDYGKQGFDHNRIIPFIPVAVDRVLIYCRQLLLLSWLIVGGLKNIKYIDSHSVKFRRTTPGSMSFSSQEGTLQPHTLVALAQPTTP